jgi:predicted HTH domain antitoxin
MRYLGILLPGVKLINMEEGSPDDVPPEITQSSDDAQAAASQLTLSQPTMQSDLREQEQRRLDSLPGAIVPLERMTVEQMMICLTERRIYFSPNYSKEDMQELLRENGYTLASEYVRKLTAEKLRLAELPDVEDMTIDELRQELSNRGVACHSTDIEELQDLLLSTGYPGPEMKFFISQVDLNFGVSLSPTSPDTKTENPLKRPADVLDDAVPVTDVVPDAVGDVVGDAVADAVVDVVGDAVVDAVVGAVGDGYNFDGVGADLGVVGDSVEMEHKKARLEP